jgi:L-alanine-DL-glutamate epimerase-like enolase superfamily enzyme
VVEIEAGGKTGLGYTYSDASITALIECKFAELVIGRSTFDIAGVDAALWRAVCSLGRSGLAATAISAIDAALWDVKAKLLGTRLAALLGRRRDSVEIYGSRGFTTIPTNGYATSSRPKTRPGSRQGGRRAIGDAALFVDANGAFSAKQALGLAERFAEYRVAWFEQPVSSNDLHGLALVRTGGPTGMDIAAGEYGYSLDDFHLWLPVVDVLQADMRR